VKSGIEGRGFLQQPNGELVKSQKPDIEKRTSLLGTQQPSQAPAQRVRRHNDGERREGIGGLERSDFADERQFEIGMERTGDDPQHEKVEAQAEVE
jgi:hypothetical protein